VVVPSTIKFPILLAVGSVLHAESGSGATKHWIHSHDSGSRFLFKHGSQTQFRSAFLIDREGSFCRLTFVGIKRAWAGILADYVWDFSLGKYELASAQSLSCEELAGALREVRWDPHFSKAGRLRRFVGGLAPQARFGPEEFRSFWDAHCPRLAADEWQKDLP
jgi:hypothetical protein